MVNYQRRKRFLFLSISICFSDDSTNHRSDQLPVIFISLFMINRHSKKIHRDAYIISEISLFKSFIHRTKAMLREAK